MEAVNVQQVAQLIRLFYQDLRDDLRRDIDTFLRTIPNDSLIEEYFSIRSIAQRVRARPGQAAILDADIYQDFRYLFDHKVLLGNPGGFGIPYRIGNYYMKMMARPLTHQRTYVVDYTPTNKKLIRMPEHCIEYFMGVLLANYVPNTTTPSFMNTYCMIRGPRGHNMRFNIPGRHGLFDARLATFTFYELLTPFGQLFGHFTPFNYQVNKVSYSIFQTLFALHNAQTACHFVHNDLHEGNIMGRRYDVHILKKYVIGNGQYVYTNFDFDTVIIDYGLSRLESESVIVTNNNDQVIGEIGSLERFEFNPYTDVASFLIRLWLFGFDGRIRDIADRLVRLLLRIPAGITTNNFLTDNNLTVRNWRLHARNVRLLPLAPLSVINIINQIQMPIQNNQAALLDLLQTQNIIVKSTVDLPNALFQNVYSNISILHPDNGLEEGMKNSIVELIIPDPTAIATLADPFNYAEVMPQALFFNMYIVNYFNNQPIPYSHQFRAGYGDLFGHNKIYSAIINLNNMAAMAACTFKLECCHIDGISYLEDERIIEGVVINAAFFNINTDFENVGPTIIERNPIHFQSNNPIPDDYRPYYHQILIDNNEIVINPNSVANGPPLPIGPTVTAEFHSGPLLIRNGQRVFTQNNYNTMNANGVRIFQCEPNVFNNPVHINKGGINYVVKNCNSPPGELFHAANMNPRSALVITDDHQGNRTVQFVSVPGRGPRGIANGMTLSEFSRYLHANIPNINMAINLDGGQSSRLCVKYGGTIKTFNYTFDHVGNKESARAYPVGSILSFVRTQPAPLVPFQAMPPGMVHFQGKRRSKKTKNEKKCNSKKRR